MRRGEACHDRRIESWRPRAADSPPQTRRPCAAKPINVTVSHRRPIPLTLAGVLLVATLWLIAALIVGAAPGAAASPSVDVGATQLLDQQLSAYATTAGPFSSGVWNSPNQVCWACNEGGPATAAATSWLVGGSGDAADLGWAEATVDHVIATEQLANGSYQADAGSSPDITTMFWGVEMGTTYLELEPTLSASERGGRLPHRPRRPDLVHERQRRSGRGRVLLPHLPGHRRSGVPVGVQHDLEHRPAARPATLAGGGPGGHPDSHRVR